MIKLFQDYGNWMNLFKGNYRKGANSLRGILTNPEAAVQMLADDGALMAIYGDVDYTDGSCWCADVIGATEYAPEAFNRYLNLIGVSEKATWDQTAADLPTLNAILKAGLLEVIEHSPAIVVPKRDLASDSWAVIRSAQAAASLVYSRKDTKDVNLTGIGTMTVEIADFDHDFLTPSTAGEKAPITFLTKHLLYTTYQMNTSNTNSGGFPASALQTTLNGTIHDALPADLQEVIRTIYKWYGTGSATTNGQWSGHKLWVPLEYEMGLSSYSPATEQSNGARAYPIFTSNASRVKKLSNGAGAANAYWEASPHASTSGNFCNVNNGGAASYYNAASALGVCFGFCV